HLQNIYKLLGDTPPPDLSRPISKRVLRPLHTSPRGLLSVKIDGRLTFFEWLHAGCYTSHNQRGTMAQVTPGAIKELHFGFDLSSLLVRIDFEERARQAVADFTALRVGFVEPEGWEVLVTWPGDSAPRGVLHHAGSKAQTTIE